MSPPWLPNILFIVLVKDEHNSSKQLTLQQNYSSLIKKKGGKKRLRAEFDKSPSSPMNTQKLSYLDQRRKQRGNIEIEMN